MSQITRAGESAGSAQDQLAFLALMSSHPARTPEPWGLGFLSSEFSKVTVPQFVQGRFHMTSLPTDNRNLKIRVEGPSNH